MDRTVQLSEGLQRAASQAAEVRCRRAALNQPGLPDDPRRVGAHRPAGQRPAGRSRPGPVHRFCAVSATASSVVNR